jgi:hypothetical protein
MDIHNLEDGKCAHAQPEQILVSNAIAELCIGKGLSIEDIGEVTLKDFGSPARAYAAGMVTVIIQILSAINCRFFRPNSR